MLSITCFAIVMGAFKVKFQQICLSVPDWNNYIASGIEPIK